MLSPMISKLFTTSKKQISWASIIVKHYTAIKRLFCTQQALAAKKQLETWYSPRVAFHKPKCISEFKKTHRFIFYAL